MSRTLWQVVLAIAWLLLKILSWLGPQKLRLFFSERARPWTAVPKGMPVVWVHASSGEIESARPLFRRLKQERPEIFLLVTAFSPSALSLRQRSPEIDFFCLAPWDFSFAVRNFLEHFRPRCVVFSRGDLWPETLHQLKQKNIPSLLMAYSPHNLHRWQLRLLKQLSRILVVSEEGQKTLRSHALQSDVGGDPRFETVVQRLQSSRLGARPWKEKTLVLGSMWPEDESALFLGIEWWLDQGGKVVWAPHEKHSPPQMTRWNLQLWSSQSWRENVKILWVDQIGPLAELYQWGDVAIVGGGFRRRVHSVMEALAAGCPTASGPKNRNSPEAQDFATMTLPSGLSAFTPLNSEAQIHLYLETAWHLSEDQRAEDRAFLQKQIQARQGATETVLQWVQNQIQS